MNEECIAHESYESLEKRYDELLIKWRKATTQNLRYRTIIKELAKAIGDLEEDEVE